MIAVGVSAERSQLVMAEEETRIEVRLTRHLRRIGAMTVNYLLDRFAV